LLISVQGMTAGNGGLGYVFSPQLFSNYTSPEEKILSIHLQREIGEGQLVRQILTATDDSGAMKEHCACGEILL
jgi:hypothetical protein